MGGARSLVLASLILGACGSRAAAGTPASPTPDAVARRACATVNAGEGNVLVAAFSSTARQVVHWQETRGGAGARDPRPSSRWRSVPPDTVLYVCWFDGFFAASQPPPAAGQTPMPPYDRADLIVASGVASPDAIGHRASLPLVPPR